MRLLQKLKREADLNQEEIGSKLGQPQSYISKCLRGERRLDIIELQAFCEVLGVTLGEFVKQLEKAQQMKSEAKLREFLGEEWP